MEAIYEIIALVAMRMLPNFKPGAEEGPAGQGQEHMMSTGNISSARETESFLTCKFQKGVLLT